MKITAKFTYVITLLYLSAMAKSQYLNLAQYETIPEPIAYNLHRLTEPRSVNDLSGPHLQRAKHDVSTTITQVQRLLALDPNLPRLTRGEIEELFENVTKEEYDRSLRIGDLDRAKHMRALMLVLPYNTNSSTNGNLEELYTRPPITKMVDPAFNPKPITVTMTKPPSTKFNIPALPKFQMPDREKLQPIASIYKETTTYRPKKPIMPVLIKTTKVPVPVTQKPTAFRPTEIVEKPVQKVPQYDEAVIMAIKKKNNNKFSSHYSVHAAPFMPSADTSKTTQEPMRENVKDLLGAIGLYPEASLKAVKPSLQSVVQLKQVPSTPVTITSTTTTTTPQPAASSVKSPEITPELKGLLQSFGFLNEADKKYKLDNTDYHEFKPLPDSMKDTDLFITPYVANHPDIVSDDFSSFKPIQFNENIPAKNNVDPEFENLLKSFGLIDFNQKRAKKSMTQEIGDHATSTTVTEKATITSPAVPTKMKDMPPVAVDMLPSSMIKILDNLGITTKKHNHNYDNTSPTVAPIDFKQSRKLISKRAHGFRLPNQTADEDDYDKLKQLLETIKQLDKLNANLSDEEISKLNLKHYNLSSNLLTHGPDPLDNIELLNKKNEVKRQENSSDVNDPVRISLSLTETKNDSSSDSAVTTTTENTSSTSSVDQISIDGDTTEETTEIITTTTTEEPSRSDSEDSFSSGADPVAEEPLPPPRRNGFYFLQDVNKFLEVGEEPDIVEVRYERKFGDPSRFLPITVP